MDTTSETHFAPGCFGSALTYADDDHCRACAFSAQCSVKSKRALDELRSRLNITVKERRRSSNEMSRKAQEIFEKLGKSAGEIRATLMAGENPFPIKRGFMGDVCFVLLNSPQVTRAFLAQVIEYRCKVNASVAAIYARQAIQILRHCGAITEQEDGISVIKG